VFSELGGPTGAGIPARCSGVRTGCSVVLSGVSGSTARHRPRRLPRPGPHRREHHPGRHRRLPARADRRRPLPPSRTRHQQLTVAASATGLGLDAREKDGHRRTCGASVLAEQQTPEGGREGLLGPGRRCRPLLPGSSRQRADAVPALRRTTTSFLFAPAVSRPEPPAASGRPRATVRGRRGSSSSAASTSRLDRLAAPGHQRPRAHRGLRRRLHRRGPARPPAAQAAAAPRPQGRRAERQRQGSTLEVRALALAAPTGPSKTALRRRKPRRSGVFFGPSDL
jgi:hypothetical protein